MKYKVDSKQIKIILPSKNIGKFRYKNRDSIRDFGQSHATKSKTYNDKTYLEWQIGYDVRTSDIIKKPTSLSHLEFVGANGSKKHPFELSELLYEGIKIGFFILEDIVKIKKKIISFSDCK